MRKIALWRSVRRQAAVALALAASPRAIGGAESAPPEAERPPAWVQQLPERVLAWLAPLQYQPQGVDEPWGLFTFSRDSTVRYSVYATATAWDLAECCGGLDKLPGYTADAKARMARFIQQLQDPNTGHFRDPLVEAGYNKPEGLREHHATVTKCALNLLSLCGAKPLHPYSYAGGGGQFEPAQYLATVKQGNWDRPWEIGSHAGLQTVELFWRVNRGHAEWIPTLKEGMDFILSKQNPQTGMWGDTSVPLDQQLGGALKVIGRFHFGLGLVAPHMDHLADTLIANHHSRAVYRADTSSVIPRNVGELAYACLEASDYRKKDLRQVLRGVLEELRAFQQPDGAFAQQRDGKAPVVWNGVIVAPTTKTARGDMHGTHACLYTLRSMGLWLGWQRSPFPVEQHWREQLAARKPLYQLRLDADGRVEIQPVVGAATVTPPR